MSVQRRVMKFLVPLQIKSLGRMDLTGRASVPFYINPQSFNIQEGKIINETLTKGGYVVQYWGEQLTELQVSGTTGSGGIEAVNVLRGVYRNEITQFNNLLLERAFQLDQAAREELNDTSGANIGSGVVSILDQFTIGFGQESGAISGIRAGLDSAIEEITRAARGISDRNPVSVELVPTIGAFAVSMILYWQGEKFLGYFKNFRVDESAQSPGIFEYNFSFMVTKRSGTRTNFMPWHRRATDLSGVPITVSTPIEGAREGELSFPNTQANLVRSQLNEQNPSRTNSITSSFTQTQESSSEDINQVNINRNSILRGS